MDQAAMKKVFLESFDLYNDALFRFCLVKTSNKELAEDLTQETFMRYWQSLKDGKEMTHTRSFLYKIANNLVIDWYRKKKAISLEQTMERGFEAAADDHTEIILSAEYLEAFDAIMKLEVEDREVLLLRFVEGLDPKDIAQSTGLSPNVISVRINRAMKRLQKQLLQQHE